MKRISPILILLTVTILSPIFSCNKNANLASTQPSAKIFVTPPPAGTISVKSAQVISAKHPSSGEAHCTLGLAYYKERKYNEAIIEFDRSIQLLPIKVDYHIDSYVYDIFFYSGDSYTMLGEPTKARMMYQKLLVKKPTTNAIKFLYHSIGNTYWDEGNFDMASEAYNNSLKIDSNYSEALLGLGVIATMHGNYENALKYLTKALKYQHKTRMKAKIYAALGDLDKKQGNKLNARKNYLLALENNREMSYAKDQLTGLN